MIFLPNKNRHSKLLPIQGYRNVLNNDLLKIILSGLGKLENLKKLYVDNCDLTQAQKEQLENIFEPKGCKIIGMIRTILYEPSKNG